MRRAAWIVVAVAALGLLAVSAGNARASSASRLSTTQVEQGVLAELNKVRRRHGLAQLRLSSRLSSAALLHSETMVRYGFFRHESRDGSPFWKRVERYYGRRGYREWAVGENLLWASPDVEPAAAVRAWMRSLAHRRNVLDPKWREIGLSAVREQAAPGVFAGLEITAVTADFGIRR